MDHSQPGSSVHGDSPGKNNGVGYHAFLQIFPTQGWNPGLQYCRWILYQLSHQGSPGVLEWIASRCSRGSSWSRNQTGVSLWQVGSLPAELLVKTQREHSIGGCILPETEGGSWERAVTLSGIAQHTWKKIVTGGFLMLISCLVILFPEREVAKWRKQLAWCTA